MALAGVTYTKIASIVDQAGVVTCPAPWVYSAAADVSGVNGVTAGAGACVIPAGAGGCFSVFFTPPEFKFLRGTVLGVQFGDVCAFGPNTRSKNLNGEYQLSGLSDLNKRNDSLVTRGVGALVTMRGQATTSTACPSRLFLTAPRLATISGRWLLVFLTMHHQRVA